MDGVAPASWFNTRRGALTALLLGLAAAVSLGIYERSLSPGSAGSDVSRAINSAVNGGIDGFNSVAALLAGRSPGERAKGALASLKNKRQPLLHQRALAKVRRPNRARPIGTGAIPPLSNVPIAEVPPAVASPLFNALSAPPATIIPATVPAAGGRPAIFPAISSPGGGGGVVIPPLIPSAPDVPVTPPLIPPAIPPVSAVPELATWAMMLLGFGGIGMATRRSTRRVGSIMQSAYLPAATE